MTARWRKLIGGAAMVAFVVGYAIAAVTLYDRLPDWAWLRLAYMATAGVCWGLPLIPLMGWMNRGR